MEIILEFEPIVKLVCYAAYCVNNLTNCANEASEQQWACNLKQITIGDKGECLNFKQMEKKE